MRSHCCTGWNVPSLQWTWALQFILSCSHYTVLLPLILANAPHGRQQCQANALFTLVCLLKTSAQLFYQIICKESIYSIFNYLGIVWKLLIWRPWKHHIPHHTFFCISQIVLGDGLTHCGGFFMGFVDIKRSFKFDKTTYIGQISLCLHVNFYISDIELLITAVSEAT